MAKQAFDVCVSLAGLILLFPLFVIIMLLIKVDTRGPVFFRGLRIGQGGREFRIYKFRTMVTNASEYGSGITTSKDPRITRVGQILRQTKLDELPQLINVVKGEMSLVGPRPEDPRYVAHYTAEQRQLLTLRPGITSPASLEYRDESALLDGQDWETIYLTKILPHKLHIELDYAQSRTLFSDIVLILRSVCAMFHKHVWLYSTKI